MKLSSELVSTFQTCIFPFYFFLKEKTNRMSEIPVSAVLLLPFPHQALHAAVGHWTTEKTLFFSHQLLPVALNTLNFCFRKL